METKTRILVADSNQDFCRLITDTFSREKDLDVVGVAGDGIEALNMLAQFKPDLLLMDLVLPKLDGLEVLRRLSKSGNRSSIIVLSAFVNSKVIADCSALGADYFMPKPCDIPALLSRIRQLSGNREASLPPAWTAVSSWLPAGRTWTWRRWSPI